MTLVNTETGEIVEPGTSLAPINRTAASVVTVLENAKAWLSTAVDMTGPEEIAAAKAHIRTAETYARELHLSKDIQLDAAEMVRRAEYALGRAIRKGQDEGTVAKRGDLGGVPPRATRRTQPEHLVRARDMFGNANEWNDSLDMADNADPEQFDAALEEAKSEGNLSRANVVRKVKNQVGPTTRDQRADLIADLATQGYSSRQMPEKVGVSEETVRQIARDFGIEIPADKAIRKTRRHNSHRIASETVATLEGLAMGVRLINYDEIDPREAEQWAASLTDSLSELRRFHKQIKETTHA